LSSTLGVELGRCELGSDELVTLFVFD
jgi:hypothetical protein